MSYHITIADAGGPRHTYGPIDTFEKALGCYRWLRDQYKGGAVVVHLYNADRCDDDSDGLTDEERERL